MYKGDDLPDDLAGADLSGRDLRYADLSGQSLFGTDLRRTQLFGAKISLDCAAFDGVKLDESQMAMLLLMIAQADMPTAAWRDGIYALVESEIGEQQFRALKRYLQLA